VTIQSSHCPGGLACMIAAESDVKEGWTGTVIVLSEQQKCITCLVCLS